MKVDADSAGLDATRLERLTEHLQQQYIDSGRIAGCQLAVSRAGQVGYFRSFGTMDRERAKPVTDDTIWRIYSMTKPITGVALMSLYERGLFQLNDRVSRFIPSWKDLQVREVGPDGTERLVAPQREMTVRDLLMHMSGLRFPGGKTILDLLSPEALSSGTSPAPSTRGGEGATLESVVESLAHQPLDFHPGTKWSYTISTDICGRLVEILADRPFDEYLRDTIFDPLGMVDTGFSVPDEAVDRFAALYLRNSRKELKLIDDPTTSKYRQHPSYLSGGGGLVSTTGDYLRFGQMLANGGELDGVRILGRKTVDLIASNHIPGGGDMRSVALPGGYGEVEFEGMGFGLTVSVSLDPARTGVVGSAGEFMWGGAASTIFWVDPAEELVVVFMTQLMPSGTFNFRGQLKSIVYGALAD